MSRSNHVVLNVREPSARKGGEMVEAQDEPEFEAFAGYALRRLRRAYLSDRGVDGADEAAAEALAYAWEHWGRVSAMEHPVAYLYRVGLTRTTALRKPALPLPEPGRIPEFEPLLLTTLLELPERQRVAVWLIHACRWTYRETGDALGISASAVGTHVSRGMTRMRERLGGSEL